MVPYWKTRKDFLLAIEQTHIDITFSIPLKAVSHSQRPKEVGTGVRLRLQGWSTKGEQRKSRGTGGPSVATTEGIGDTGAIILYLAKHIDCKTTRERSSTLIFFVELYVYETDSLRIERILFRGLSLCHSLASQNSVALPVLGASPVRLSAIVAVCGHIHRTIVLILCTTLSSLRRTHFIPLR